MLYMNLLYIHAGKQRVVVFLKLQKVNNQDVCQGGQLNTPLPGTVPFFGIDYGYLMINQNLDGSLI